MQNVSFSKHYLLNKTYDTCTSVAIGVRKRKVFDEEGYLFRSYDHIWNRNRHRDRPRNPGPACQASIVDVSRATSAAPSFFKEVCIAENKLNPDARTGYSRFMDGAVLHNNPSDLAWQEVCAWQIGVYDIEPRFTSPSNAIGCFVSIGCGRTQWQIFGNEGEQPLTKYRRMSGAPQKMITDTVRVPL